MPFSLPELPFNPETLSPWASAETFFYHHGKHHAAYVNKLNAAIEGSDLMNQPLEEIIAKTRNNQPGIFNHAAQHFNHDVFWRSLSTELQKLSADFEAKLAYNFGSLTAFRDEFTQKAAGLFGSGWIWLVQLSDGKLAIHQYSNAETPAGTDVRGLLPLDVWEHAYYIDHRNDRGKFIDGFWEHINWRAVEERLTL
ncbi:superoxide dismutase [Patescibacteria group bacterium]|nr:superoxide dismutase [Patescibacteria group bacterium]MBU1029212.1 superoxide dismutase [Patescibacteria group bacterium]MBU1915718.1 superoxide dismutase [Patescibacteria group bacterium]